MESSVGNKSKRQRTPNYDVATVALRSFLPTTYDSRKELLVSDLKQIMNIMKRTCSEHVKPAEHRLASYLCKKAFMNQTSVEIMQTYFPDTASLLIDPDEDVDSSDENSLNV